MEMPILSLGKPKKKNCYGSSIGSCGICAILNRTPFLVYMCACVCICKGKIIHCVCGYEVCSNTNTAKFRFKKLVQISVTEWHSGNTLTRAFSIGFNFKS